MAKWVLCKDHLPEEGEGTKWVTVKRVSNIRWVGQAFYDHEEEMWLDPGYGVPLMVQPIAWMDIEYPEPYEGEV